jgi:hypothetical protein
LAKFSKRRKFSYIHTDWTNNIFPNFFCPYKSLSQIRNTRYPSEERMHLCEKQMLRIKKKIWCHNNNCVHLEQTKKIPFEKKKKKKNLAPNLS